MKTRIHINQHNIKANTKGAELPVITVKDYKRNRKTNAAEILDSNGRMPLAFASFMRSLGYLAWMFIAFVFIVAVPDKNVWYWAAGFGLLIPVVNRLLIGWKNSVKDKTKVLNAE